MDCCSKYPNYSGTPPMASRVGDAVLSNGPPNRLAPNVTLVPGHRHPQALRYQEQQHRLAALHSSEGFYHQQQHGFDRFLPNVSYPGYHPASYGPPGPSGLGYGNLGRRGEAAAYLNHHTHHAQHSHHLYHPPHYDSTYNGRMIGGAGGGGAASHPYGPYRGAYEHQQGVPSSVLHYTPRNGAFQYGHHLSSASPSSQQREREREYLHYYPYHHHHYPPAEQRYGQHNLHSINGLQHLSSKDDGRPKGDDRHITEAEASYGQQQQQSMPPSSSSLSSLGITMIASPMASGSTTTDSGISGSSRCGSTPVSSVTTSAGFSGDYSLVASSSGGSDEGGAAVKDPKDEHRSLPATPDAIDESGSSLKDQVSPKPPCIKSVPTSTSASASVSSPGESERPFNGKLCASSRRMETSVPMISTPERCSTPYISSTRLQANFQPSQRYQSGHNKWSPNRFEPSETTQSFSPKPFSPKPRKKRIQSPMNAVKTFEVKKNRVVECDLIPSRKSKRKLDPQQSSDIREEIRDIKPLPGFQQAFGSTEIGRFFETFLNIPSSPYDSVYSCESEADTLSPQPWEIENSVDGSQYDVQIGASLQSVYKTSLGDKHYLSGIRCNGY